SRLPLIRSASANRLAVEYAALKVHIAAPDARHQGRTTDGPRTGAGVERHQDKPGQMLAHIGAGSAATVTLAGTPRGPDQMRGFLSREPSVTGFRRIWQHRAEYDIRTADSMRLPLKK